jgi:hypothetical protein
LSTNNIDELLHRFHGFDDAVLERFAVTFRDKGKFGTGEVALLARDSTSKEAGTWFKVNLRFEGISEFRLTENSRCSNRVLYSGLKVQSIDNRVWTIFDQDQIASSADEARRSHFYICRAELRAEVNPIALP